MVATGKMSELIQADESFVTVKNSHRMDQSNTSAWCVNLKEIGIKDDLAEALNWKKQQVDPFSPATPNQKNDTEKSEQGKIPF